MRHAPVPRPSAGFDVKLTARCIDPNSTSTQGSSPSFSAKGSVADAWIYHHPTLGRLITGNMAILLKKTDAPPIPG